MRLHLFAGLLLGLYSPEEIMRFAVQWLGPAFLPVGSWFAGNYANQIAEEVGRRGMLRDKVFWDAMVLDRPLREVDILKVACLFFRRSSRSSRKRAEAILVRASSLLTELLIMDPADPTRNGIFSSIMNMHKDRCFDEFRVRDQLAWALLLSTPVSEWDLDA